MNPLLMTDFYKTGHVYQYPEGTEYVYSNLTARKSRVQGVDGIVFFGLQMFIERFLHGHFQYYFFDVPLQDVMDDYRLIMEQCLGDRTHDWNHIKKLHDLGYLPIQINAVPEGTYVPIGVPCMTIVNTHPDFYWLTNSLETLMSCSLWQACTSATLARRFKGLLLDYAIETDPANVGFVDYQGHDFSMRGMSSYESAVYSGTGHLTSFKGTDTIPAILSALKCYSLPEAFTSFASLGGSVAATEHSVMCLGTDSGELETFRRLITKTQPSGIISIVSDTWNLWNVLTDILPELKDVIMARDGKVVIRPDSSRTNPQDIICGTDKPFETGKWGEVERKGLVESLWDIFGGTVNDQGYKVLDSHIGAIYGDAISYERAVEICERLRKKGFASTNVVYGIGSYTYQMNTRDTFGFAIKATCGQVNGEVREIYKDPITDSGEKRSAKGVIKVVRENGVLKMLDQQDLPMRHSEGELKPVFVNGDAIGFNWFDDVRKRVADSLD